MTAAQYAQVLDAPETDLTQARGPAVQPYTLERFVGKPVTIQFVTPKNEHHELIHTLKATVLGVNPSGVIADITESKNSYSSSSDYGPALSGISFIPWQAFSRGGGISLDGERTAHVSANIG